MMNPKSRAARRAGEREITTEKREKAVNYDGLVNTTADIGYLLIVNGAEISRAEESMRRVFCAYGSEDGEVFAIPNYLCVSVGAEDGRPVTAIRRIPPQQINMNRVERVNDLCRRICRAKPSLDSVKRELDRISRMPSVPLPVQFAACAFVAAAFTLFYGGSPADAAVAFLCGAVMRPFGWAMERFRVNRFFNYLFSSFAAAAIALLFAHEWVFLSYDKIIIGALMNLVPGIAVTGFMRDIIAGDMIAGILRFTESLLVATSIAIGAGIALTLMRTLLGV